MAENQAGALQGDYSSLYQTIPMSQGDTTDANIQRHWLGALITGTGDKEREDWNRQEQSANNALYRDMQLMQEQNIFNASEAQKSRDWQTEMSNTAYQRAVSDMKAAGLNPVLAYSNGGASTPSGSTASSGSGHSSGGQRAPSSDGGASSAAMVAKIVAGLVSGGASIAASGLSAAISAQSREKVASMRKKK
ncbi:DNA pilot protein [Sigmofec virus UA08Rod_5092]|uniref:DNA pilot protein n=1 Tax=Sigmofec virus UA08Rod_5092 TaxID=2929415 RepID=A0A976N1L2_9VIRU|nr:DNA pilot protein [Sigmofec virus UA08Rod_5092]